MKKLIILLLLAVGFILSIALLLRVIILGSTNAAVDNELSSSYSSSKTVLLHRCAILEQKNLFQP